MCNWDTESIAINIMLTIKQHRPAATWPMVKRIWCLTIWELNGMFHKIEHVLLSWARLYERLNMWKLSVLIHATNLCQIKYQILVITEIFQKWNWFNLPTTWEWFYLQLKSTLISILVKTLVTGLNFKKARHQQHDSYQRWLIEDSENDLLQAQSLHSVTAVTDPEDIYINKAKCAPLS